jgi:hypothetical protein
MADCNPCSTPLATDVKLTKEMNAKSEEELLAMENVPYREAVGGLIYLMNSSRPDICHAVSVVSKFCQNPGPQHWTAVKRILRYLKGTKSFGLKLGSAKGTLVGYSDSDWAGDLDDRRSTSGFVFFLFNGAVVWLSKKQPTVALSSAEAEYISLAEATKEATWLSQFLEQIKLPVARPVSLFVDSQSAICLAKGSGQHSRAKHIDIKWHFVRDAVESQLVALEYESTDKMVADVLTKPLPRPKHSQFTEALGVMPLPEE